jgi:hypothetical protein
VPCETREAREQKGDSDDDGQDRVGRRVDRCAGRQRLLESWGWAQLQSPVTGLLVGIGQSEEVKQGGGATLTFTVKDIDVARAYLEGEGVRFDGETSQVEDMVRLATFYDPDGNALMLAQQLG